MRVIDYILYLKTVCPDFKFDGVIFCKAFPTDADKMNNEFATYHKLELNDEIHQVDGCYDLEENNGMYKSYLDMEIVTCEDRLWYIPEEGLLDACKADPDKKYIVLFVEELFAE